MDLNDILAVALRGNASDIHLKAGLPPMFRINGSLVPLKEGQRISPEETSRMALSIMNNIQRERFKQLNELDLAYGVPGLGRFRVNVFQQRGTVGIVLRVIPFKVRSLDELNLPQILKTIAMEERGMVLVTGTTGSGKSTTLAGMIDHINTHKTAHIMTVEDPIEFLIRDRRSVINQREVGVDTLSFSQALKSALRQDPDVILVGEMRDLETIETALLAAETGHMVFSTLHTLDATETISRVVSVFPPHQQRQIRLQLGAVLKAVICQRLVPTRDERGRVAALEIMRQTPRIRELVEDKDRTKEIHDAIADGHISYGMQTFDQALMAHYKNGIISYEEAMKQASNASNFALRVQGIESTSDSKWSDFEGAKETPAGAPTQPIPRPGSTTGRVPPPRSSSTGGRNPT
ncbi:MAG: type IV pilus twitching motility protein PilT [Deltaproteobacteria bacterium]|nr:type IV pilus twitching motility protein PilT [Deltaproteobacteria bacterium]